MWGYYTEHFLLENVFNTWYAIICGSSLKCDELRPANGVQAIFADYTGFTLPFFVAISLGLWLARNNSRNERGQNSMKQTGRGTRATDRVRPAGRLLRGLFSATMTTVWAALTSYVGSYCLT